MKDKAVLTLKGLAISGVVFHHLLNRRFSDSALNTIDLLPILFSWCVLAFFAVSGWLHSLSDDRHKKTIPSFVMSRAGRLLLPFVVLVFCYSLIWQFIQCLHLNGIGEKVPQHFIDKIWASIPPTSGHEVAEQLYFFPLLFIICSLVHIMLRLCGIYGVIFLGATAFFVGLVLYPDSANTGFNLGVGVWGGVSYAAGFVLCKYQRFPRWVMGSSLLMALVVLIFIGGLGLAKIAPIFLLVLMHRLRFDLVPILPRVGEASATIYVYHTPFLLQPLVIIATLLPSGNLQFWGAILASVISILVCTVIFYRLRTTFMRFVIL